jgi:EAL domain-containing protein (putative c-di-GMP-specific phosphodiesterase class I)
VDTLLRRADTALYEAKSDGKGRWREYHEGMATPGRRTTDLRHQLEAAIRDQTVTLHYEPIVELATGRAEGFEALIRLDSRAGHPMQPEELVAITEDSALMSALNDWVLHKALTDITIINRSGAGRPRHVGVTFSARQLRQPGFAETVRTQLAATNVDAEFLIIGIAESVLLAQESEAWNLLAQLRDDGVRVAVDDYGIGYASLSCLRHSELDIVKIDGSFLAELTSRRSRLLLEAVVRLPATLGLDEIAKGVDDMHARDMLVSLGCRYGQGSLYGAAMPLSEAVRWQPAERRT